MKTFATALIATFVALVVATPFNPHQGSGAGSTHLRGSRNDGHHRPQFNNGNHTINGTTTIRTTITHTRTSTIFVEATPTSFNGTFILSASAVPTEDISAPFTPVDIAEATPTPSTDESDDAGLW
ncbi:hypothetical protein CFE70_000042 [Pyrenophora teres f. teres 0-1]|uniref:Uncharacterized protein n=2 Tax=Pyrenophora teres f. teres TaxID=97479 RepID=E3S0D9_PYRTT|nr:hypothetical protein PTT_15514 [Pyrenophora teres f. teres 0-1]KAE8836712.1 hypothetical protein HRS9139_04810 [Pyrenophora teres f. teres]KAE8837315.1 hypothetical protein PTNB85_04650 [Pyrenophora teres f. teres]KAE8840262.1 hypothetical protein HRS9122_06867 [Pyrenophora teres f. teres]KAE8862141.1 hypothetical protein PTNB29_04703 [Pyrenophora teres f. teres]